ncbi:MAG: DUF2635 domain-containing protein [Planctomycetota bacterium]|nr:MAG: DUF2635 domain-containing protein [Planctomycetota bacterium]
MDTLHVAPSSPDLKVVDPETYLPIPPEGAEVQKTTYWMRRLRSGDVVEIEPLGGEE